MDKTGFFTRVHNVATMVPHGRVTTYGAIARFLGAAGSARMVGWAMNASHNNTEVPAHRVVNRIGMLTGKHHFAGTRVMEQLLESEGVRVEENQVQDFDRLFWDPLHHLDPEEF